MKLYFTLLTLVSLMPCFPAAAQSSDAMYDYSHALAYVLSEIRGTKWKEELCSEKFPETKAKNVAAYAQWKTRNTALINEMEGQFAVVERHWRAIAPDNVDIGAAVRQMSDGIDSNKDKLKALYESRGDETFRAVCEAYPERVASPRIDLESVLSERLAIVRRGLN